MCGEISKTAARARAPRDWRLAVWCALVFPIIGLLAIPPQLLGNGKGLAQAGFDSEVGLTLAATLLLFRLVVLVASLRAGAEGGLLTPGLSIGALLGIILGSFWNHIWPTQSLAGLAIVGGAAFLAVSMKMPLTAIVLTVEFTGIGQVTSIYRMVFHSLRSLRLCVMTTPVLQLSWRLLDSCKCRGTVLHSLAAAGRMGALPGV